MKELLKVFLTVLISNSIMFLSIAFVVNSIDIMNWPWIARLALVIWGLYVVDYLLNKVR